MIPFQKFPLAKNRGRGKLNNKERRRRRRRTIKGVLGHKKEIIVIRRKKEIKDSGFSCCSGIFFSQHREQLRATPPHTRKCRHHIAGRPAPTVQLQTEAANVESGDRHLITLSFGANCLGSAAPLRVSLIRTFAPRRAVGPQAGAPLAISALINFPTRQSSPSPPHLPPSLPPLRCGRPPP